MTVFTVFPLWAWTLFRSRTQKTGAETLRKVADSAYAVIYITEGLAAELADEIEKYKEKMMPSIILIPGISGNTGVGVENVKKCVEKAVGSDIIFGEK